MSKSPRSSAALLFFSAAGLLLLLSIAAWYAASRMRSSQVSNGTVAAAAAAGAAAAPPIVPRAAKPPTQSSAVPAQTPIARPVPARSPSPARPPTSARVPAPRLHAPAAPALASSASKSLNVEDLTTTEAVQAFLSGPGGGGGADGVRDKPGMLLVYSPMCGACAALKPKFDAAADEATKRNFRVRWARVNVREVVAREVLTAHNVKMIPTVLLRSANGIVTKMSDANSARTIEGLLKAAESLSLRLE